MHDDPKAIIPSFVARYGDWAETKAANNAKEETKEIIKKYDSEYGFKNDEEMYDFVLNFMRATDTQIHQYMTEGSEFGIVLTKKEELRREGKEEECFAMFFNEGSYCDNLFAVEKFDDVVKACTWVCGYLALDNGFNQ